MTGGTWVPEPAPKSDLESGPSLTPAVLQDLPSVESEATCRTTSEIAESTAWALLALGPELASWEINMATLPPLSLDDPANATPPAVPPLMILDYSVTTTVLDPFKYHYGPQTAIDPLDNFLATYAPKTLPQPLPASNALCISQYIHRQW